MRTEYCFTVDGAELVYVRQAQGLQVITINHCDKYGKQQLCSCWVDEGALAERAFFNHFGDDDSWPEGWYLALLRREPLKYTKLRWHSRNRPAPKNSLGFFIRESWRKENYS